MPLKIKNGWRDVSEFFNLLKLCWALSEKKRRGAWCQEIWVKLAENVNGLESDGWRDEVHPAFCNLHCVHLQIPRAHLCAWYTAHFALWIVHSARIGCALCTLCTCRYLVYTVRHIWCSTHSALCIMQLNVTFTLKTHKRYEKLTLTRIIWYSAQIPNTPYKHFLRNWSEQYDFRPESILEWFTRLHSLCRRS